MIQIRKCVKGYPGRNGQTVTPALDGIELTVKDHEFISLLGPSGCGKTTLLKLAAGLIPCDAGDILIDGQPVKGPGPDRAMVFQDFALLPWADVLSNVALGLEFQGMQKEKRRKIAMEWIQAVGLSGFEHHFPRELSGGMQQRVGLARALSVNPAILLMDEPFGSVDSQTRRLLQEDLQRLHYQERKTVLFVTHSMDEAVNMGDRVVLFTTRPGRILECVDVPFPRPRHPEVRKSQLYVELKEHLWNRIRGMQSKSSGLTT
jgi:NitT/TauT family transport system ATP-binding protein